MDNAILWMTSIVLAIIALAGMAMVVVFIFYSLAAPAISFVLEQFRNFQNSENSKK